MTTIINTPTTPPVVESSDSGISVVLGVVVGIAIVILFLIYGLPAIRSNSTQQTPQNSSIDVNVKLPPGTTVPPADSSQ